MLQPPEEPPQAGTDSATPPVLGCSPCPVQCPPKGLSRSPLPSGWSTSPEPQGAPKCGSAPSTALLGLTFLHRNGWLLLPQPQEYEEEHQGDEDLEGQHPLGMTQSRGNRMLRNRTQPPGRSTRGPQALVQCSTVSTYCKWLVVLSQPSQRKQVPKHPTTSCQHHPVQSTAGHGQVHRGDGSPFQQCKQAAGS